MEKKESWFLFLEKKELPPYSESIHRENIVIFLVISLSTDQIENDPENDHFTLNIVIVLHTVVIHTSHGYIRDH